MAIMGTYSPTNVYVGTYFTPVTSAVNQALVDDPFINERVAKINAFENMQNQTERNRLVKEYGVYALGQAYGIVPPAPYQYTFWQPWVKDYVTNVGYFNNNGAKYLWIDQELKQKMTGRR